MDPKWEQLYHDLQADLCRCLALEHPEKVNVENCFWIAWNYWEQIQVILAKEGFNNEADEIVFYREVKPMFARYIEYYSLLSEGLQFEPPLIPYPQDLKEPIDRSDWDRENQRTISQYWIAEEQRGLRFYKKHEAFLDYYASGKRDCDRMYFLPGNTLVSGGDAGPRRTHNRDTDLFTVHEEILTTWEAYQLYRDYIRKKANPTLYPIVNGKQDIQ